MVFAVISGGMWVMLGPTVGAVFTQVLSEGLRVAIQGSAALKSLLGSSALALDQLIYGLLLILFIIYMPKGILGTGTDWWRRWQSKEPAPPAGWLAAGWSRRLARSCPDLACRHRRARNLDVAPPSAVGRPGEPCAREFFVNRRLRGAGGLRMDWARKAPARALGCAGRGYHSPSLARSPSAFR